MYLIHTGVNRNRLYYVIKDHFLLNCHKTIYHDIYCYQDVKTPTVYWDRRFCLYLRALRWCFEECNILCMCRNRSKDSPWLYFWHGGHILSYQTLLDGCCSAPILILGDDGQFRLDTESIAVVQDIRLLSDVLLDWKIWAKAEVNAYITFYWWQET